MHFSVSRTPGGQANILRAQFNRTGFGVAVDGVGAYYFTQDFIGTVAKSGETPVFTYSGSPAAAE